MDSYRSARNSSFGCFPYKGLKLSGLHRLKSSSSSISSKSSNSSSSSPSSPMSLATPKKVMSKEDELRQVFHHFDGDEDGKISALELRTYFASIGEYMSHEEAQDAIDEMDEDGDRLMDFQEFLRMMTREDEDDLKAAFEMFEVEKGGGRITPKSLQRVLSRLGDSKSYDECVTMIRVFDKDGNGELDFNEFIQMMA